MRIFVACFNQMGSISVARTSMPAHLENSQVAGTFQTLAGSAAGPKTTSLNMARQMTVLNFRTAPPALRNADRSLMEMLAVRVPLVAATQTPNFIEGYQIGRLDHSGKQSSPRLDSKFPVELVFSHFSYRVSTPRLATHGPYRLVENETSHLVFSPLIFCGVPKIWRGEDEPRFWLASISEQIQQQNALGDVYSRYPRWLPHGQADQHAYLDLGRDEGLNYCRNFLANMSGCFVDQSINQRTNNFHNFLAAVRIIDRAIQRTSP